MTPSDELEQLITQQHWDATYPYKHWPSIGDSHNIVLSLNEWDHDAGSSEWDDPTAEAALGADPPMWTTRKLPRKARKKPRGAHPHNSEHGTENRYRRWGCRCDLCKAAKAVAGAAARRRQKERRNG